ncbi:pyrimidine-nucleoside phosphorylase [Peptoniphilus asaccharolyticus DSM 20463]|uniref:Pyrimidine-nucleoside phosphorylase n=1 Tax=Peptoniphilus asaccharolyticus DSM 20463 TaxID=573058 RepID=A0A1W1UNA7_PEPAS|nr:pyrimidine-nucleoside phosphorylase [Peptoniphilus asaccharolyticus]MBL7574946.1 pyrimidine-nucleoside phosphorylase [Peptoniphilus asaccharolyticus]SMB82479.1 pyrimidine-nucleoside phosphorylase [Peptoniphilus asaccharolyticus DSM 20463]
MNTYEIIEKKKEGQKLSAEEIKYIVDGYTNGNIPDYQVSALLMAICLKGMDVDETFNLTNSMIESGNTIDLSKIEGKKVDKHSTGGVGDTTTLVLGPLVASCGIPFAKMSGRGLGHTGGTLDKLESIPGLSIDLDIDKFIENTNKIKIAICGQTTDVTPADKKLYALRDTTATVNDVSLISSSIMSKKIAVGADCLVLDVKVGSGAFMKTVEDAVELSEMMVNLGEKAGKNTQAVITNMNQPLGRAVGNSLEVIEAINTLRGEGPEDLYELSMELAEKLLLVSGHSKTEGEARAILEEKIASGEAFNKLKELVQLQGGDVSYIEDVSKFELSPKFELVSEVDGYVKGIDALGIGEASKNLGAGRETKESELDLGAGILLNKKIGDKVSKGELLATLYTKKENAEEIKAEVLKAFEFSNQEVGADKLILKVIKHEQ